MYANRAHLIPWSENGLIGRHDYVSPDHLIHEMLTETYFGGVLERLRVNDLIYVIDAERAMATFRIDWVDPQSRSVGFSVVERLTERPVVGTDGLAVKWRGARGGRWCVLDAEGTILSRDHISKDDAERAREIMKAKAA